MFNLLTLALVASIAAGHPPRLPQKPWSLMVSIEREGQTTWLQNRYGEREECEEDLVLVMFSTPTEGRVTNAYCERDPFVT